MEYTQIDFSGGISHFVDSTKTPRNMIRLALNARIKENGIEGAFAPILIPSPSALHQSIFAVDDQIVLAAGGTFYRLDTASNAFASLPTVAPLSSTAEFIYHEAVPAPSNFFVNEVYRTNIATFPQAIVLQDGGETDPVLLFYNLSNRRAKTYTEWTPEIPEYIPRGAMMASSGNKLFIVDPTRRKIYQSVSGRQLDFVLNLNVAGGKGGDANTTNLAVSAATAVAVQPAQAGGILAFSKAKAYELVPVPEAPAPFNEIYLHPRDVFPVGAVNHLSFTFSNGQSLFVSPFGIQSFDQVLQTFQSSNNTPFAAPIIDYVIRPITRTATAAVGDFTLIALDTKFGGGILVYNNIFQAYESIDLTAPIKEFVTTLIDGLPRVYYITYANEVYELPLYTGARRTCTVYLGEFNTSATIRPLIPRALHLTYNNVNTAGGVVVEAFQDRIKRLTKEKQLMTEKPADTLADEAPQAAPNKDDGPLKSLSFDISVDERCYAAGIHVTCAADARLVSATFEADEIAVAAPKPITADTSAEIFGIVGNVAADSTVTGETTTPVTVGNHYVYYTPAAANSLINGTDRLETDFAGDSRVFRARADRVSFAAAGKLFDFSTFAAVLDATKTYNNLFLAGELGGQAHFSPVEVLTRQRNLSPEVVSGPNDETYAAEFFAAWQRPDYYKFATTHVNFYLLSFHLDVTQIAKDTDGVLTGATPVEMTATGPWATWLWGQIQNDPDKFNVVVFNLPPYIVGDNAPGWAALRWPFKRFGVDLVVSAYDQSYQRYYADGVYYVNAGTARPLSLGTTIARRLQYAGHVKLTATSAILQCEFIANAGGTKRDGFTIIA